MRTVILDGLEIAVSLIRGQAAIRDPSNGVVLGVYRRASDGNLVWFRSFCSFLKAPPETVREYVDTYL